MIKPGWLTGWKSIANYLGVYWLTVKNWHKKYNLPVYRMPDGTPAQLPEVLDAWIIEFNRLKNQKKEKTEPPTVKK